MESSLEIESTNPENEMQNSVKEDDIKTTDELCDDKGVVDKTEDEVILINGEFYENQQSDTSKNYDGIKIENSHFSNDNCQVTISSNHSTIINTSEIPHDKSNISIVTIEDGKNISIKSSDSFKCTKSNSVNGTNVNDNQRVNIDDKENNKKIVLSNEYVPNNVKDKRASSVENVKPNDVKSKRLSQDEKASQQATNDSNKRTTIKVNLNLVSDNENEKRSNKPLKSDTANSNLLTRIDQVNSTAINSRNYEKNHWNNDSKNLKRESSTSSSCFSSIGSSDKENGNIISSVEEQIVLRKKREMVCVL